MTDPNLTEIIIVLDTSGSMEPIAGDMEGALKSLLADQAAQPGDCLVTLVQFSTDVHTRFKGVAVASVPPIDIRPRGVTALYDAIGQAIDGAGSRFGEMRPNERPSKVIVVIITDGLDNNSKRWTKEKVAEAIKHQREIYSWEFLFLGANQDAFAAGSALNVGVGSSVTFDHSTRGTKAAGQAVSEVISGYRSHGLMANVDERYRGALDNSDNE